PKNANLQDIDGSRARCGAGCPDIFTEVAHDWRQVLTFQGKSCSVFTSFTIPALIHDREAIIMSSG
ncbi:MAG TPA: hypothetical protein VIY29_19385, partial [Ktedonobacteraceae bacterium]